MALIEGTLWCDGCGVEILARPIIAGRFHYCCQDCLQGRVCTCGDRMEQEEGRRGQQVSEIPTIPANALS